MIVKRIWYSFVLCVSIISGSAVLAMAESENSSSYEFTVIVPLKVKNIKAFNSYRDSILEPHLKAVRVTCDFLRGSSYNSIAVKTFEEISQLEGMTNFSKDFKFQTNYDANYDVENHPITNYRCKIEFKIGEHFLLPETLQQISGQNTNIKLLKSYSKGSLEGSF